MIGGAAKEKKKNGVREGEGAGRRETAGGRGGAGGILHNVLNLVGLF